MIKNKLYLLTSLNTKEPVDGEYFNFVISARNGSAARKFAQILQDSNTGECKNIWIDDTYSTCICIGESNDCNSNDSKIILSEMMK